MTASYVGDNEIVAVNHFYACWFFSWKGQFLNEWYFDSF